LDFDEHFRPDRIRGPPGRFQAFKIRVDTDIRHGSEDPGKVSPPGTVQRGSEDFPVFGLCATTMRAGPLLKRPHKLFINAAYQQVSHLIAPGTDDINDIIFPTACQSRTYQARVANGRAA
jgi:hypothetical protein